MHGLELLAITIYFFFLFTIGYLSYQRNLSSRDFIIGSRSLNYWLTALSAHASDMSGWLFLGYPAVVFSKGWVGVWTAIGLIIFMYLNWQFIAPKIRVATERSNSITFSSFFEHRVTDISGVISSLSGLMLIVFYTIYVSAGLTGLGDLISSLFNLDYKIAVSIGITFVIPYIFFGGYKTLAWIDLFQGIFLLFIILSVPVYVVCQQIHSPLIDLNTYGRSTSLFPDFSASTVISIISTVFGWGLGYFGQPHIVTKFMGIKQVSEMPKSKWIGMSWMTLSLAGASWIGILGIYFFKGWLENPETLFIKMVQLSFSPFISGFILCAVLAAIINAMSSQMLVLTSSLTEDFYKKIFRPNASSGELLFISRSGILLVGAISLCIALPKNNTIYELVQYAWSGIGSSFGPLVILSLYSDRINKYGAWAGILGGGIIALVWPKINTLLLSYLICPMLPGFIGGFILILLVSRATNKLAKLS